jgi:hypothetical protein
MELKVVESAFSMDRPVTCPAGTLVETAEGPTCFCAHEQGKISVAKDITSFSMFCAGDNNVDPLTGYQVCPTWRAARDMEDRVGSSAKLIAPDGMRRNYSVEDLMEIEERVAAGDTEGALAIARRIAESRAEQGLRDVSQA